MVGNRVLVLLPISLWAGLLSTPCVGTFLMFSRAKYWSSPVLVVLRNIRLAVFTADSILPLALLWWGEVVVCSMPQLLVNFLNSLESNCGPLSLTNCLGMPYLAR